MKGYFLTLDILLAAVFLLTLLTSLNQFFPSTPSHELKGRTKNILLILEKNGILEKASLSSEKEGERILKENLLKLLPENIGVILNLTLYSPERGNFIQEREYNVSIPGGWEPKNLAKSKRIFVVRNDTDLLYGVVELFGGIK